MKSSTMMILFWILGLISISLILVFSIAAGVIILPIAIGSIIYFLYKINNIKIINKKS